MLAVHLLNYPALEWLSFNLLNYPLAYCLNVCSRNAAITLFCRGVISLLRSFFVIRQKRLQTTRRAPLHPAVLKATNHLRIENIYCLPSGPCARGPCQLPQPPSARQQNTHVTHSQQRKTLALNRLHMYVLSFLISGNKMEFCWCSTNGLILPFSSHFSSRHQPGQARKLGFSGTPKMDASDS